MKRCKDPIHTVENLLSRNRIRGISIYQVVLISIVLIVGSLPFIYVDVTRHSRGLVRSRTKAVPLKTAVNGKIQWTGLADNKKVQQGDTLMTISDKAIRNRIALTDSIYRSIELLSSDIRKLLADSISELSTTEARQMYTAFLSDKKGLEERTRNAGNYLKRQKRLYKRNVIARQEYEQAVFEFRETQQALSLLIDRYRLGWEEELFDQEQQLKELRKDLSGLVEAHENYFMTAPVSGTLEQVPGVTAGSVVRSSQMVGIISPDTELVVENLVSPADIGLIGIGQAVIFQFDAFHFRHWGVLHGEVLDIDKNITLGDQGPYFRVHCELQDNILALNGGYEAQIRKGMTLTTRYIIARRSLAELIFDTMGNWLDPIKNRSGKSEYF